MKKRYYAALMAFMICLLAGLAGKPAYAIAKAVILEPDTLTMYVGEKQQIKMYVGGTAVAAAGWSSDNKKVATVNKKGMVTAKKAGKVTITCKTGFGYNLTCKITVKKKLELSGYLNKNYKKLVKKAPEAKHLTQYYDPAGIGNVYVFERANKGTEPFFRYDQKTKKLQSIQISSVGGDSRQKRFKLYGASLGMTAKKAKAALKAKKCKYSGKQTYSSVTHLIYKKGGHTITLFITKGKVTTIQWTR